MINPRVPGQRGLDDGEADGGGGGAGAGEAAARGDQRLHQMALDLESLPLLQAQVRLY